MKIQYFGLLPNLFFFQKNTQKKRQPNKNAKQEKEETKKSLTKNKKHNEKTI